MEGRKTACSSHQSPPAPSVSSRNGPPTTSHSLILKTPSKKNSKQEHRAAPPEPALPPIICVDISDRTHAAAAFSASSERQSKAQVFPLAPSFSPFLILPSPGSQPPLLVTPIATASSSLDCRAGDNRKLEALGETEPDGERTDREHKKRSKNWTRQETLQLIKLRTEMKPRFAKSGRKAELWDEIAQSMQRERIYRDAQQCRDKWEKLSARYKDVKGGLKDREDNPFFDELHPLLADKSVKRGKEKEALERDDVTGVPVKYAPKEAEREGEGDREEETGDGWEEDDEDTDGKTPARKKSKESKYIAVRDLTVVQSLLESIILKQQTFFKDLLEDMERREQMREQQRQEKEDKWRAEERAQRCVFNNAMILLTQGLVEAAGPAAIVAPSSPEGPQGSKKRSKNWKRTEVLQLIKVRGSMESRFQSSTKRTGVWEEVGDLLMKQGIKRDAKQCREKWDKLIAAYRDAAADGKREKGDSPYYTELTGIFGSRPTLTA